MIIVTMGVLVCLRWDTFRVTLKRRKQGPSEEGQLTHDRPTRKQASWDLNPALPESKAHFTSSTK